MSKYDQLAFASRPNFYLASPSTVDQSGSGTYSIATNNLTAGGQPIIYGHENAFKIQSGSTATINGNLVFRTGVTTELVVLASAPIQETEIILADNGSGLFIAPDSVVLRLNYIKDEVAKSLVAEVPIEDWHKKLYMKVTLGDNQAALTVNGESSIVSLDGILDTNIINTSLGSSFATGYYFLLDGFGVYSRRLFDKADSLDDPLAGHNIYAAAIFGGRSTDFSTYSKGEVLSVGLNDFTFYSDVQEESYIFNYSVPANENNISYVAIQTNDDSLSVDWDLSGAEVNSFIRYLVVPITSAGEVISFKVPRQTPSKFNMRVENVISADILSESPAKLTATGQPIFPIEVADSIVNCPQGVVMDFASYSGEWLTADSAVEAPPQSVELIFKPQEAAVIFSSADGQISISAQNGYSMWLNGVSVTDLTNILMGQWNHLVLTKSGAAATSFTLNDSNNKINYLLLSAYPQVLDGSAVQQLYKVSIGADIISVTETPVTLAEGTFENGQPFQLFGNSWSIVGAGGN